MDIPVDEQALKTIVKAAIVEVLEERRDLVRELLDEALEDVGLLAAIMQEEQTVAVDRQAIFALLDDAR